MKLLVTQVFLKYPTNSLLNKEEVYVQKHSWWIEFLLKNLFDEHVLYFKVQECGEEELILMGLWQTLWKLSSLFS